MVVEFDVPEWDYRRLVPHPIGGECNLFREAEYVSGMTLADGLVALRMAESKADAKRRLQGRVEVMIGIETITIMLQRGREIGQLWSEKFFLHEWPAGFLP